MVILLLVISLNEFMSNGYKGVRKASSFPEARTEAAEKFVEVSPAVGLGPRISMIKKRKAETQ